MQSRSSNHTVPRGTPAAAPLRRARTTREIALSNLCTAVAKCHYKVLGVETTASEGDIKRAFRQLALQLHPDVNPSADATSAFKAAKNAYEVLSDPQQRAAYNTTLKRKAHRSQSSTNTRTGSSGTGSHSGNRACHQHSRDPFMEFVVNNFSDLEVDEEEDFLDPAAAGFYGWYAQSGSWQSSWDANRKKRQRHQQPEQQQRQAHWQQRQQLQAVGQLLQQQDAQTLGVVAQVFGKQLEHLSSVEELLDLLAGLELLRKEGIKPDANMFGARRSNTSKSANSSRTSTSRSHSSSSSRAGTQQATKQSNGTARSSSNGSSRRSSASSAARPRSTAGSWQRSGGSRSRSMPRFEEMTYEELFTAMQDVSNPQVAQAAREFASTYQFADPGLAADMEALLTLEYLTGDWDDSSVFAGLQPNSSSSPWQHVSFDFSHHAERQKHKAKPGSARDYVKYQHDDSTDDFVDVRKAMNAFLDVDEFIMQPGWACDDSDSDAEDEPRRVYWG